MEKCEISLACSTSRLSELPPREKKLESTDSLVAGGRLRVVRTASITPASTGFVEARLSPPAGVNWSTGDGKCLTSSLPEIVRGNDLRYTTTAGFMYSAS